MRKILIIPSWYASKSAPTSGSFFKEQAQLLSADFEIQVWVTEKNWISKRRWIYNSWFKPDSRFLETPLEITPPVGKTIFYPFCSKSSDEENLIEEINALVYFLKKNKASKAFYPDLIHAHCSLKGGVLAAALSKELGIPFIISEHLNPFLLHNYSVFWKSKIMEALNQANEILAVSDHQKQQMLMHEVKRTPITTGNLVDELRFDIPPEKQIITKFKGLIVTYYPNFIKDMNTFFETMVFIKNEKLQDNFEFTIVGGGELQGEYKENHYQCTIEKLGLADFVKVIPSASRDEMVTLMQETNVFISTSIAETFGVAICEAMLCGKPVISTINGGVNDYANEQNSVLIPLKDPEALLNAIIRVKEEHTFFDTKKIRNSIVSKYGSQAFRQRIAKIYTDVIES